MCTGRAGELERGGREGGEVCALVICGLRYCTLQVMLAVHSETRILYALKVVPKAKITTQKQVNQILAESKILK